MSAAKLPQTALTQSSLYLPRMSMISVPARPPARPYALALRVCTAKLLPSAVSVCVYLSRWRARKVKKQKKIKKSKREMEAEKTTTTTNRARSGDALACSSRRRLSSVSSLSLSPLQETTLALLSSLLSLEVSQTLNNLRVAAARERPLLLC